MGRVFKPKYAWRKPDGTLVEKITEAWYIEFYRAGRTIRRKAGLSFEQAKDALRQAESEVLAEKNGLPTRSSGHIPIADLVKSYLAAQAPHWSPDHLPNRKRQIAYVLAQTRAFLVRDLTPEKMDVVLDELSDQGLAARTVNIYLAAMKALLNWAVRRRMLPYNVLACIPPRRGDAKNPRRALTLDEGRRLLTAAFEGPRRRMERAYRGRFQKSTKPVNFRLDVQGRLAQEGRRNTLAYRLCMTCGLRKEELRALTWNDVDLDGANLYIRGDKGDKLRGVFSAQEIPIPPETIDALRAWRDEFKAIGTDPVVKIRTVFSVTFNDDLRAAGIQKRDSRGRVVDLHALRHTCGTWLNSAGVDPKSIQTIMRHKDIKTTYGIYIHADKSRLKAAATAFPKLIAHGVSVCKNDAQLEQRA